MADIQIKVAKQSKRNRISRAFHAKNDSQTIASWKVDLNRVLLIFNVSCIVPPWPALTIHTQTELGLNIYATASDVRDGVTKTHTAVAGTHEVVSEVQRDVADTHVIVADTHVMVSGIHRQMLGSQEETDDQPLSVSNARIMPTLNTCSSFPRTKPGQ